MQPKENEASVAMFPLYCLHPALGSGKTLMAQPFLSSSQNNVLLWAEGT